MLRSKFTKLFLILGVILLSLVGVVGCSKSGDRNSVDATYISTYFADDHIDGQFKVVNNHIDLVTLLENDTPERYNDDYFETKSLLVFKIIESSSGNKSEIESYTINDKTLNVYVKTKQYGDTADMGYWWFMLELSNEEIETFDEVKIFKNGKEMMDDIYKDLLNEAIKCYFENYIEVNRPSASIEDVWLFKNLGEYDGNFVGIFLDRKDCDFPEEEISVEVNGFVFSYSYGYNILVYSNKLFYSLTDAFDNEILTGSNIEEIYKCYYDLK